MESSEQARMVRSTLANRMPRQTGEDIAEAVSRLLRVRRQGVLAEPAWSGNKQRLIDLAHHV